MSDEPEETYPPCRCGREYKKINVASWRPSCVGCGLPNQECRCRCYRPKNHEGACGEPLSQEEDETAILFGSCGPHPRPTGIIYACPGLLLTGAGRSDMVIVP